MLHGINGTPEVSFTDIPQNTEIKNIQNIEEFSDFLRENKARIEERPGHLALIICGRGSIKAGGQLRPRPDLQTEISVYVQSNDYRCNVIFNLPLTIVVKGPRSSVQIPATLLTRQAILDAFARVSL